MSTTEFLLVIVLAAMLILLAVVLVALKRQGRYDPTTVIEASLNNLKSDILGRQMEGLVGLRDSLDSAQRLMNERLAEGSSALDKRLELFGRIEKQLGELATQTKSIETVGLNIQSLSELLRPPQLRGALGEILLENLLGQILPVSLYAMQYRFASGRRVDAIVRLADRLLPIDSKFPMESYQRMVRDNNDKARKELHRALRKHIDDIASKYVLPGENTTDIAVMYIPSEAVYYSLVSDSDGDILQYSLGKNVVPSSPAHLYAFLASLAAVYAQAGLVGSGRELVAGLSALGESLQRLVKYHERMEGSVRRLTTSLGHVGGELSEMAGRLEGLRQPAGLADTTPSRPDDSPD